MNDANVENVLKGVTEEERKEAFTLLFARMVNSEQRKYKDKKVKNKV